MRKSTIPGLKDNDDSRNEGMCVRLICKSLKQLKRCYLFIQHIFIKSLLFARYYVVWWGWNCDQGRQSACPLRSYIPVFSDCGQLRYNEQTMLPFQASVFPPVKWVSWIHPGAVEFLLLSAHQ